ncbi:MAG: carbamoyl-phosphate synthase (glutamine-hydrolyzing) large subunit [bacterium]|nr:carbamoyl-phosphate synthase (glutamine-hydrolyzing) large subunit [bacterium]
MTNPSTRLARSGLSSPSSSQQVAKYSAKERKLKKVLVLGSGALKIGEAGEFDYSGSQAMKAFKEAGLSTVLVNPNIATIQTSPMLADSIYFLPVNDYFVEKIIAKERPEGIALSFGGQTALNCGMRLGERGVLKKYGVRVLGSPLNSIILTEDRHKFAEHLKKIDIPVPPSGAAATTREAQAIADRIGFPVMVRAAFALGGQKSGVARNARELKDIVSAALGISPQVLVEKYLHHYKEIEYEVVRDIYDNCVTVCNMENMDPLGIHTGDSIVVAPSQTLTSNEYHGLRAASIKIVKSLGIVGECNVQFALNPRPANGSTKLTTGGNLNYYVIEVNARLSRSSALASKATGYPLAYVAAKLALGKALHEIQNQITKVTQSFFEPALDYVVVKIPRWDINKFARAEETIGSAMKSVGEVMGIGRTFEEALQKAVRMLHIHLQGATDDVPGDAGIPIEHRLKVPTPRRLYAIAAGIRAGLSIDAIYKLTGIDPWFLYRIQNIAKVEKEIRKGKLNKDKILRAKQFGFSDARIGYLVEKSELEIRALRKKFRVLPSVFQIDTLAGEVPAETNYLYLTYNGSHHDVQPLGGKSVMVLGSGPYHIGSSVEFDWSAVNTVLALKRDGKKAIMLNCNPETVSTDYDISDRLYFENVSLESVADIYEFEHASGTVISVGGQASNNLASRLGALKIPILGTHQKDIDRAEDRNKFSALLDKLGIKQPEWNSFTTMRAAESFAKKVGYPVLVRPSYVLSGSAMRVCADQNDLEQFVEQAALLNEEYPVTISKFISGAKEIEFDAVAQRGKITVSAIAEHIENAGVHSGDATIVYPPQKVYAKTAHEIQTIAEKLALALRVTGPFNLQCLVKDNKVCVIEMNIRASRTFPFISKATGVNFAEMIVDAFYGRARAVPLSYPGYAVVKSPQFSFGRLPGADPVLHVEMSSTGEVACFGRDFEEALLSSIAASTSLDGHKNAFISLGGPLNKKKFLESAESLAAAGFTLYATNNTAKFLVDHGLTANRVYKVSEKKNPNALQLIQKKTVAFVINVSDFEKQSAKKSRTERSDGYHIRRAAVDANIPLFTDLQLARAFVRARTIYHMDDITVTSWQEYLKNGQ